MNMQQYGNATLAKQNNKRNCFIIVLRTANTYNRPYFFMQRATQFSASNMGNFKFR